MKHKTLFYLANIATLIILLPSMTYAVIGLGYLLGAKALMHTITSGEGNNLFIAILSFICLFALTMLLLMISRLSRYASYFDELETGLGEVLDAKRKYEQATRQVLKSIDNNKTPIQ